MPTVIKGYTIDGAPCCIDCAKLTNAPDADKVPVYDRKEVFADFPIKDAYPVKCFWCDAVIFPASVV